MTSIYTIFLIFTIFIARFNIGMAMAIAANTYMIRTALSPGDDEPLIISLILPLVIIFIVIKRLIKKKNKLTSKKIELLDKLLILLGLLFLVSSENIGGVEYTARYFILGISFYFAGKSLIYLTREHIYFHEVFNNLSLGFVVIGILVPVIAFLNGNINLESRMFLGTSNPIPVSTVFGHIIIFNSYFLFIKNLQIKANLLLFTQIMLWLSNLLSMLIMFQSSSRGPLLSVVIALMLLTYFKIKYISKSLTNIIDRHSKSISSILSTFGIASMLIFFAQKYTEQVWNNVAKRIESLFHFVAQDSWEQTRDLSIAARLEHQEVSMNLFEKYPLFGVGTNNYPLGYPHNVFLEILSQHGIVGLFILGLIILVVINKILMSLKYCKQEPIFVVLLSLLVFNFLIIQFSFSIWQYKYLYLFLGFFVSLLHKYELYLSYNLSKNCEES